MSSKMKNQPIASIVLIPNKENLSQPPPKATCYNFTSFQKEWLPPFLYCQHHCFSTVTMEKQLALQANLTKTSPMLCDHVSVGSIHGTSVRMQLMLEPNLLSINNLLSLTAAVNREGLDQMRGQETSVATDKFF